MVDTSQEMAQVSDSIVPRSALAPAILRLRTAAYLILAALIVIAWLFNRESVGIPAIGFTVVALLPYLDRGLTRWHRVEIAVALDVIVAAGVWWRLPGDPTLSLVITLWAIAIGAFFCSEDMERLLVGMVAFIELAKLPLAVRLFPGRFGPTSFFRDAFSSEWLLQSALTIGRLGILAATYVLFRTISRYYRISQAAVVESEDRYRTLVESSPTTLLVIKDEVIVYANPAAPELAGLPVEEIEGRSILDFVSDERRTLARSALDDTQAYGTLQRVDGVPLHQPNGAVRRVNAVLSPTTYLGEPAVHAVLQDITDRYHSERAIAASEERYRQFFERLPVALYRSAPDGRIINANQETVRLLGVADESELVNRMATSFYVNSDDRDSFGRTIRRHGAVTQHEVPLRRATGDLIWISDSARVVQTPDGDVYEGALIDISARKRAEELAERRARQQEAIARIGHLALAGAALAPLFRAAAEAMARELDAEITAVVCLLDDGNLALEAGTGWTEVEDAESVVSSKSADHHHFVIESPSPVFIPDLELETRFEPSASLIQTGAKTGASVRIPGSDSTLGTLSAFRRDSIPFTDDDVHFLETLGNVIGAAIERQKSRDLLEELIRSKDQFVAAVSHEVRTPLTVVSGLAQELLERWNQFDRAEVEELLELLVSQSREMGNLIEDLLVSARADIGRVEIRPQALDLAEHVAAVLGPLADTEASRISFHQGSAHAIADPIRLRQIIRNLITNALRYGGPEISVIVGNGGATAYLEVRDNGGAIDSEHRDRIFEPYHRVHQVPGLTGSVGLGLAVSRTLAEMMDGTLTYSHDGETVFRLTLPGS